MNTNTENQIQRPPVIVVMGHIDHGKSTLLDYIRKTNIAETEAGGITQHISAYEINRADEKGDEKQITFLDTPGHKAFAAMRTRGAAVADIAILVVAADDSVQQQTKEAHEAIEESDLPFIVAINKIDKPQADPKKVKSDLTENGIYVEGFGGNTPVVEVSAKTGEDVEQLLDMILLVAEMSELTGRADLPASGVVIETQVDPKRGTSASLLIKEGTLKKGMYIQAGAAVSPTRIMEDFQGDDVKEIGISSPVRITGFDTTPKVGQQFQAYTKRSKAEEAAQAFQENQSADENMISSPDADTDATVPVMIKTDVAGTADAVRYEIEQLQTERVDVDIVNTGVGAITESDIHVAGSTEGDPVIVGFNVGLDSHVKDVARQKDISVESFDVIYNLTDWIEKELKKRTPTITVKKPHGKAKIKKTFSQQGNEQVLGGEVKKGTLQNGDMVTIFRRGEELADGEILELQQQKISADKVDEGNEFGAKIESRIDIAPDDILQAYSLVEK
jgi:translation initiation factor IF-2